MRSTFPILHFRLRTGWAWTVSHGWSMSCGWAHAMREHVHEGEQLARFFAFIDEYRQLRPVVLCRVTLNERHQPTGKRTCVGSGLLTPPPLKMEIVQYAPEPLHFLRFSLSGGCGG